VLRINIKYLKNMNNLKIKISFIGYSYLIKR